MKLQELFEEVSAGVVSSTNIAGVRDNISSTNDMITRLGVTSSNIDRLPYARNRKKPLLKIITTQESICQS